MLSIGIIAQITLVALEAKTDQELINCLATICSAKDINKLSTEELVNKVKPFKDDIDKIANDLKQITIEEFKQRIDSKQSNLKVINVLGEKYYLDCHIRTEPPVESLNWDLRMIVHFAKNTDRSTPLILYCACEECNASEKAAVLLRCMGFENVCEYIGGMRGWYNKFKSESPSAYVGDCKYDYLVEQEPSEPQH